MSSASRCYSPLKTRIMFIKAQDHHDQRRDSFEIDVFDASSYYSGFSSGRGFRDTSKKEDGVQTAGNDDDCRMRRHSINAVRYYEEPQKKEKRSHKKQPSSPGAKLASYLNSLFNQSLVSKHKKKAPLSDEDGRSSSSMSLARSEKMAAGDTASMYSHSTYTSYTGPTPSSAHTRWPAYKDLRSYSSYSSKQALTEEKVGRGGSAALAWFDQELKLRKEVTQGHHQVLKNDVREDDGDDSDSSSDLFELQNYDLGRHSSGELPVHGTTKYQQ